MNKGVETEFNPTVILIETYSDPIEVVLVRSVPNASKLSIEPVYGLESGLCKEKVIGHRLRGVLMVA